MYATNVVGTKKLDPGDSSNSMVIITQDVDTILHCIFVGLTNGVQLQSLTGDSWLVCCLFVFCKAKENIQEMKKELDSLMETAEKAFKVELLKIPVAIRKMKRKDLLNLQGKEEAAAAVVGNDPLVEDLPKSKVVRTGSRKVKVTTIVEYEDEKKVSTNMPQKASKTKSLVTVSGLSSKQNNSLPRSMCSASNMRHAVKTFTSDATPRNYRTNARVARSSGLPQTAHLRTAPSSGKVHGMLLRSNSVPRKKAVPFVNIPLSDGQTLSTAGEDLRNINMELLNDDTVQHIHNLVSQLTVLCGKATVKPS
ncbi:PREDICTED: borealin-2-like [Gavialis gangeticus]|uniref:borealin-2-like n=1 Tax=Gavialis gangeticus TaxID=94835 RepID=UPI00092EB224|nr:PREDICTED: borealin-2-like [Gavialis gangeticus]